jgi:CTP synthase
MEKLSLRCDDNFEMSDWLEFLDMMAHPAFEIDIALTGKYTSIKDAYLSVNEALTHAAIHNGIKVNIRPIEAEEIEKHGADAVLSGINGVLVAGGFGSRGMEGKIAAAGYARENKIPYFGLCLGMHAAVIEFARNVLRLASANSYEMDPGTLHPVVHLMEDQKKVDSLGGTMRLGAYPCCLKENSRAHGAYGVPDILERHRHRYEYNTSDRDRMEAAGMQVTGVYQEKNLVEIVEIEDHPWFVGVQFHPELLSRPLRPHPLFRDFIAAAKNTAGR